MQTPTELQINPIPEDLDGQCAVKHFLGKSVEQAFEMFTDAFGLYQEDLLFMGPSGFRYYFSSAARYAESAEAVSDGYVAETMLMLVHTRWMFDKSQLTAMRSELCEFMRRLLDRVDRLEVSREEQDRLRAACQELLLQLESA